MPRPRSQQAHDKVIDAALQLFSKRGIEGTSIDAIAALSGVSKATIYKHWADKDALCLDVLACAHLPEVPIPFPADPNRTIKEELIATLAHRPPEAQLRLQAQLHPHLMAYAVRNPAFGDAWRTRVTDPPRRKIKELLTRAIAEGQLPPDVRLDIAEALLLGPLLYRKIFNAPDAPDEQQLAKSAVEAFWKANAGSG